MLPGRPGSLDARGLRLQHERLLLHRVLLAHGEAHVSTSPTAAPSEAATAPRLGVGAKGKGALCLPLSGRCCWGSSSEGGRLREDGDSGRSHGDTRLLGLQEGSFVCPGAMCCRRGEGPLKMKAVHFVITPVSSFRRESLVRPLLGLELVVS